MGWWTDIAFPQYGCPNVGGRMVEQRGVVLHIAEGTYSGTISWQMNPASQVSSHFIVAKDGRITQMVDTDLTAWTQAEGNGRWLSVENEGYVPDALTDAQLTANAMILARAQQEYGVPLQVTNTPDGYGLGHHSMGAENGYNWGHSQCPGTTIKNQKPEVVARAKGEDVSAKDVWDYDIDPSGNKYSAGGAQKTTLDRTAYLANQFAPDVLATLERLEDRVADVQYRDAPDPDGLRRALALLTVLAMLAGIVAAVALGVALTHRY